jgi:hypothetical protein
MILNKYSLKLIKSLYELINSEVFKGGSVIYFNQSNFLYINLDLPSDFNLFTKADLNNQAKNLNKSNLKEELLKDLRMKTFGELAHFVRCLPFFEENRKTNEIWLSSDFVLTLKKGNIQGNI